jgi:hypothetical protein
MKRRTVLDFTRRRSSRVSFRFVPFRFVRSKVSDAVTSTRPPERVNTLLAARSSLLSPFAAAAAPSSSFNSFARDSIVLLLLLSPTAASHAVTSNFSSSCVAYVGE